MSAHCLPPGDAFRLPGGRLCSPQRAIVFNSWLTWKDALSSQIRRPLSRDQAMAIGKLARILTNTHKAAFHARPRQSPFKVYRWWNPDDPSWSHGRRCLIGVDHICTDDWLPLLPDTHVIHRAKGAHLAEVLLLRSPLAPLPPPVARRRKAVLT